MRIIVISDTHRDFSVLQRIVDKHRREADLFLHLGDGERECDDLLAIDPNLPLLAVRGNCDLASIAPVSRVVAAENVKILCCHGHTFGVKSGMQTLLDAARAQNCTIALYGHTHESVNRYEEGIYLMNPGSPSCPRGCPRSYGIIDITENGIVPFLVRF